MKKLKLIVGDFHLGQGLRLPDGGINPLEDFHHDARFAEFLEHYTLKEYKGAELELIFNGDMLSLTQVSYHGHYPSVITEAVSLYKLKSVIEGHPDFFETLRDFLVPPNRTLTYIIGNHDQEMAWPQARRAFERAVGKEVQWRNTSYVIDGIHIEHGHQYEAVNHIEVSKLFLSEGLPEPVLNLPWGTLFTLKYLVRLKTKRPAIDKVRPFKALVFWSLCHDTWMALASFATLITYFAGTRFSKSRYRHSSFRATLKMLKEVTIFPELSKAAIRILRNPEIHTVVFAHSHTYKHMTLADGKDYFNVGTWIDIVSLDLESYCRRARLTYLKVEYDEEDRPRCLLRYWIGRIPMEEEVFAS